MVLPMSRTAVAPGPPPPECAENLKKLKWALLFLIGATCGRIVTGLAYDNRALEVGLLRLFMIICIGILTLRDDPHMEGAYKCLASSICQTCVENGMGGMQCMLTLSLLCITGVILDLIYISNFASVDVTWMLFIATVVGQGACATYGFMTYGQLRELASPEGLEMGGPISQGDRNDEESGGGNAGSTEGLVSGGSGGGGGGGGGRTAGFVPFSGSGQRLGS
mmetsp:Transcript_44415/g.81058  ORF Transcript_44415/g.81058 Transcript_44415/m.81058 type:complete len:222 (+) Transcript_44415:126-791(+)